MLLMFISLDADDIIHKLSVIACVGEETLVEVTLGNRTV